MRYGCDRGSAGGSPSRIGEHDRRRRLPLFVSGISLALEQLPSSSLTRIGPRRAASIASTSDCHTHPNAGIWVAHAPSRPVYVAPPVELATFRTLSSGHQLSRDRGQICAVYALSREAESRT